MFHWPIYITCFLSPSFVPLLWKLSCIMEQSCNLQKYQYFWFDLVLFLHWDKVFFFPLYMLWLLIQHLQQCFILRNAFLPLSFKYNFHKLLLVSITLCWMSWKCRSFLAFSVLSLTEGVLVPRLSECFLYIGYCTLSLVCCLLLVFYSLANPEIVPDFLLLLACATWYHYPSIRYDNMKKK